jgi:hypothetical protein
MRWVVALLAAAGCSFPGNDPAGDPDARPGQSDGPSDRPDAPPGQPDGPPGQPDAEPLPDAAPPLLITETFGERTGADHTAVTLDTYIDSLDAATKFVSDTQMIVDGPTQTSNLLLYMNISTIPATATIVSAELRLFTTGTGSAGSTGTVTAFRMNTGWDADATWNQRATGLAWPGGPGGAGGHDPGSVGSVVPSAQGTDYVIALAPSVVQGWVADPATNLGVMLSTDSTDGAFFRSSNTTLTDERPLLTITYQLP